MKAKDVDEYIANSPKELQRLSSLFSILEDHIKKMVKDQVKINDEIKKSKSLS